MITEFAVADVFSELILLSSHMLTAYHPTENDNRRDVVQIFQGNWFGRGNRIFFRMYVFESIMAVMEINPLRGNLCTVTVISFFSRTVTDVRALFSCNIPSHLRLCS